MTKVPIGSVMGWPAAVAPTLWHLLDGATLSRTTYADLFAFATDNSLLGTVFGVGDGSTTFTLPDATGRVLCHPESGFALGATRGADNHTNTEAEMVAHRHTENLWGSLDTFPAKWSGGAGSTQYYSIYIDDATGGQIATVVTGEKGSSTAYSILNPQYAMNYIMFIGPDETEESYQTITESNELIANAIEYLAGILSYLIGNQG